MRGPSVVLALQKESAVIAFDGHLGRYDIIVISSSSSQKALYISSLVSFFLFDA